MESMRLIARSRTAPWGFVVALPMALAFLLVGSLSLGSLELPGRIGIFVAPPGWFFGIVLWCFALILFLVGILELSRWLKPAVEVLMDANGVSTYGLLGAERLPWSEFTSFDSREGVLVLGTRKRTRAGGNRLVIDTNRLDASAAEIAAIIAAHRPDLRSAALVI